MSLQVLLLLSFLTVQWGGCDFDSEAVKNVQNTIDSNPTGFRTVFPKNYHVEHHYARDMLCDTDPCCVFPAAVVLLDSWGVLLENLWDKHINYSLIIDVRMALDKIIGKNENAEVFQEEMDLTSFPKFSSTPEELLKFTSELFSRWDVVKDSPSIRTCPLPTLEPVVQRTDFSPIRAKLLTTRAIRSDEDVQPDSSSSIKMLSSRGEPPSYSAVLWSSLIIRLHGWMLP